MYEFTITVTLFYVIECAEGWFGVSCNLYCHCPLSDECDNINGLCTSGKCQRGWTGPSCQIGQYSILSSHFF